MSFNNTTNISPSINYNNSYSILPGSIIYSVPIKLQNSSGENTKRKVQNIRNSVQESIKYFNNTIETAGKKQLLATAKDITFALQKSSQRLSLLNENTSEVDRLIDEMLEMKHTKSFHKLEIREENPSDLWTTLTGAVNRCYNAILDFNQQMQFPSAGASKINEINPYLIYAVELLDTGDFEQAVINVQKAIKFDPNNYKSFEILGLAYAAMGENEKAYEALSKCLTMNDSQKSESYSQIKEFIYYHRSTLEKRLEIEIKHNINSGKIKQHINSGKYKATDYIREHAEIKLKLIFCTISGFTITYLSLATIYWFLERLIEGSYQKDIARLCARKLAPYRNNSNYPELSGLIVDACFRYKNLKIGHLVKKEETYVLDIDYVEEEHNLFTFDEFCEFVLNLPNLELAKIKTINFPYKIIIPIIKTKEKEKAKSKPPKTIVKKANETEQFVDHAKPIRESYDKVFKQLFLENKTFELQSIQNELNLNKIILGCSSKVFNFLDKNQKFTQQLADIIKIFTGVSPEIKMIKDYHGLIFSIRDPKEITIKEKVINKGIALIQKLEKSITDAMNLKVVDESKWETDIQSLQEFKRFSKWEAALQSLFDQYGVLVLEREDQEMVVRFAPFKKFNNIFHDDETLAIISNCLTNLASFSYQVAWNPLYTNIVCKIPTTLDITGRLNEQLLKDYIQQRTIESAPSIAISKDTSVSSGAVSSSSRSVEIVVSATETPFRIKKLIEDSFELDKKRIHALAEILEALEKLKSTKVPYAKQYLLVRFLEIYKRLSFFQLAEVENLNAQLIRNTLLHHPLLLEGTLGSLCESLLKKTAEYRTPYHFDFRTIEKYTISWNDVDLEFCKTLISSQKNREILNSEIQTNSFRNIIQCCKEFSCLNVPIECKPIVQLGIVLAIRGFLQDDYMRWETRQMIIDKCKSIPGWVYPENSQLILSNLGDRIAHGDEQAIIYNYELQIIEQGMPAFLKEILNVLE